MLARQRAIHIDDLHIEEGDQSRRLNQDMLEKVWVKSSQDHGLQIPFWGHADLVVKQLINLTSRPHSFSPSPSLSPALSSRFQRRKTQLRTKSRPPKRRKAVHNSDRRAVSSGRIEKLFNRPSSSTRSQKVPCLYELGPNGVAVHQQLFGHVGRYGKFSKFCCS